MFHEPELRMKTTLSVPTLSADGQEILKLFYAAQQGFGSENSLARPPLPLQHELEPARCTAIGLWGKDSALSQSHQHVSRWALQNETL